MSNGSILCSALCFIFCLSSSVLLLLAFFTPNWLEPNDRYIDSVAPYKIGLWQMCSGIFHYDCWWIFPWKYDLPNWFKVTQVVMTINVVLVLTSVLLGLLLLLKCFPSKVQKIVTGLVSVFNNVIGGMGFVVIHKYDTHAPSSRVLSWSYVVCLLGATIALISGMFYTVHFIIICRSTGGSVNRKPAARNCGRVSAGGSEDRDRLLSFQQEATTF